MLISSPKVTTLDPFFNVTLSLRKRKKEKKRKRKTSTPHPFTLVVRETVYEVESTDKTVVDKVIVILITFE